MGNVIAITMEEGIAHIFVISNSKTLLKAKIDKSITKSRGAMQAKKADISKAKFFDQIINALVKNFTEDGQSANAKVSCVVIGSPGFTRENFFNYMRGQTDKRAGAFLKDIIDKTILCLIKLFIILMKIQFQERN